jgi:CubicO group peptidase (beta-lactamase class C family)
VFRGKIVRVPLDAVSLRATAIIKQLLVAYLLPGAFFVLSADIPWETVPPEERGLSGAHLEAARSELAARGTKTFLVVRDGKILFEWYAPEWNASRKHYTASLAKSLVGGTSLLLAWNDGLIDPDDRASRYVPGWSNDPGKSAIKLRHLATHSSGLEDAEQDGIPHMELPGWKGAFWRKDPDPFSMAVGEAPLIFAPGSSYAYSNPGMAALAYAVTASLTGTEHTDVRTLLRDRVMEPIGIPESDWSVGYGQTYEVDGLPLVPNWGGGNFTARAIARVGQWMLQRGEWSDRPLVDPALVEKVTGYAGMPLPARSATNPQPGSGLGWYSNFDGVWPRVPRDAFAGAGAGQQVLVVIPSLDLIVVRTGSQIEEDPDGDRFWGGIHNYILSPLMDAVDAGGTPPPYPQSAVIGGVEFEPGSAIRCAAPGSDNWPLTWADDGHLYTSYGDGNGFEPRTEKKLSQGFARIVGPAESFRGENVRTSTGETLGDGVKGPKASGLIMVDGVLYAWIRNTGNSQLAFSEDRGKTWQWGFKFTESFATPAFLNFGRNYGGARDDYVYSYSQDGPSAYEPDDGVVLARVARQRLKDRGAYEFFSGLNPDGEARWSTDISARRPTFVFPHRCERVDAVYSPAIGRYLLAVGYGHEGGWGIYDAPTPWGPWTTAFHTDYWSLGNTHGYRLPSKWIAADGRSFYLVFSGRRHNAILWDAFCVRRAELSVAR